MGLTEEIADYREGRGIRGVWWASSAAPPCSFRSPALPLPLLAALVVTPPVG